MSEARLKSEIWVKAQLRYCDQAFLPAVVARRGDPDAGAVYLKLNRLDAGCEVLAPATGDDGRRGWVRATGETPVPEDKAEGYLARQADFDPDIWVLEIEDPKGLYRVDGPVF